MRKGISVDKAIFIAKIILNIPIFVVFLCVVVFGCFLVNEKIIAPFFIPFFFIIGLLSSWIYWSFAITIWKIWAFTNVKNVHELNQKAIWNKLIHSENNWFNKTEIVTKKQKQTLKDLEKKFEIEDVITDDISILAETKIHFSKAEPIIYILLGIFLVIGCIYLTFVNPKKVENKYFYIFDENDIFILGILIGILFIKIFFDRLKRIKPQFIFNIFGFKIENFDFMNWDDVSNEKVVLNNGQYFVFTHKNKYYKFPIHELEISINKFEKIVKVYRFRNETNKMLTN